MICDLPKFHNWISRIWNSSTLDLSIQDNKYAVFVLCTLFDYYLPFFITSEFYTLRCLF